MSNLSFASRLVLEYISHNARPFYKEGWTEVIPNCVFSPPDWKKDLDINESSFNDILNSLVKKGYLIQCPANANAFNLSEKWWPRIFWIQDLYDEKRKMKDEIEKLKKEYKKLRDIEEKQKELEQKLIDAISNIMPFYKKWCENRVEYEYYSKRVQNSL